MSTLNVPERYRNVGAHAFDLCARVSAFGLRPAGSEAITRLQKLILSEFGRFRCEVVEEDFTATTPIGRVPMKNIVAKFQGSGERVVVMSGHYDTIRAECIIPTGRRAKLWRALRWLRDPRKLAAAGFVGANDGGSSTAMLLALAPELHARNSRDSVWLTLFDGEEPFTPDADAELTFGSRHQVATWREDGTLERLAAVVNVDMIGNEGVRMLYEGNSTPWLRDVVWQLAARLGYAERFPIDVARAIQDDHLPFIHAGVDALDIITSQYGPGHGFWHTDEDTMDKLSVESFAMIAHVLMATLDELEYDGSEARSASG